MEYKNINSLSNETLLGEQLANLHLDNINLIKTSSSSSDIDRQPERRFGFHVKTSCGFIPQGNQFTDTWEEFYTRKIDEQISLIEKNYHDMKPRQLWSQFLPRLSSYFQGLALL